MVDGRVTSRKARRRGRGALGRAFLATTLASAFCLTPLSSGASQGPTSEIKRLFADANRILRDTAADARPAERLEAVLRVVGPAFAFRDAAEVALGADWHARTPDEREQFAQLLTPLLVRAVVVGVAGRARLAGSGVAVEYLGESVVGDTATVRTALASRDGGHVPVDYRLTRRDDRWVIHDVAVEGVSVVGMYRAQVVRVLQASSYGDLVARMKAKRLPEAAADEPATRTGPETTQPPSSSGPLPVASPNPGATQVHILQPREVRPAADASTAAVSRRVERDGASAGDVPARIAPAEPAKPGPMPAVAHVPTRPKGRSTYWIQVSALSSIETALRLATALLEQDYEVSMEPSQASPAAGEWLTRVRVGPFSNRAAASVMLERLRRSGYTPFLAVERR